MTKSFVIGNGVSRRGLDLATLRPHGKIYGCNALYRDFDPDVLVATDPGISREIEDSDWPSRGRFYTRQPRHDASHLISRHFGYSSGPIAASYAAAENAGTVYLIGFDLTGVHGQFNNMYAGTLHYKALGSEPTFYGNWVNQIFNIAREFDHVDFVRVGLVDQHRPLEWTRHNISFVTQLEFCSSINTVSWMNTSA